jgi:hypothetical protein
VATAQEIVTAITQRYGFDATPEEALAVLNERHATMCVRAEMMVPRRDVATTIAGEPDYVLSAQAADIKEVLLDGVPLDYAPELYGDTYDLVGTGGPTYWSFHPRANGQANLHLAPAPTQAGLALEARVVERPPDLGLTQTPLVPPEYHRALREGVAATFMAEDAEQASVADRLEARFDNACEELRRQLRRGRRSGPARIRLVWP